MCGKDDDEQKNIDLDTGSPPHVRERPGDVDLALTAAGITPACAGKTLGNVSFSCCFWDHPRMCGKDHILDSRCRHIRGSPPHVRERPPEQFKQMGADRITPACAGKTF